MKRVVVFDVLGTLFSLDALRAKLTDACAPPATLEAWFERTQHGALTLTTVGEFRPFREVARAALQTTLAPEPRRAASLLDAAEVLLAAGLA
jgi:2-haloacid dehalogenase